MVYVVSGPLSLGRSFYVGYGQRGNGSLTLVTAAYVGLRNIYSAVSLNPDNVPLVTVRLRPRCYVTGLEFYFFPYIAVIDADPLAR